MRHFAVPMLLLLAGGLLSYPPLGALGGMAPNLAAHLLWLGATWLTAHFAVRYLFPLLFVRERQAEIPVILKDLAAILVWIVAFFLYLSYHYHYDLTGLWTTSSVLLAVMGFALRGVLLDLFSGVAMGFDRPFRIGDWIEMESGTVGQVESMTWRVTKIVTRDKIVQVIPNSMLASVALKNFGSERYFREKIDIEFDYHITAERAERLLIGAAANIPEVRDAPKRPDTKITGFSKRGVQWQLRFWLNNYSERDRLHYEIQKNIMRNLHVSGVSVSKDKIDVTQSGDPFDAERDNVGVLLRHTDIFKPFFPEEIAFLSANAARKRYSEGEAVILFGEAGESLYLVLEGSLSVHVPSPEAPAKTVEVAKLAPGEFFGEMSLLTGEARSATVLADVDTVVYEVRQAHLRPILEKREDILEALNALLIRRHESNRRRLERAGAAMPAVTPEANFLVRMKKVFLGGK